MAKKRINIVLIIIVIALWGSVLYRTLYRYFSSQEITNNSTNISGNIKFNQIHKDTFALEKISRDPFLNKQNQENIIRSQKEYIPKNVVTSQKPIVIAKPKIKQLIVWPAISYHGYIKDSKGELAIMKIDNKMYRLRKDALVNGISLKKISRDSLELNFNSERKIITRFKV
ncbi:hypothetical protein [Flavobacterium sp. 3-210]